MNIAVIGANGNLGKSVVELATKKGLNVKAFDYVGGDSIIQKSLFDLTKEDLKDVDVVISAYGSGLKSDPTLNKKAFEKYIELLDHTSMYLITIAGAGSLYCDNTHTLFEYQLDSHPAKLKEISHQICLGVDQLQKHLDFNWCVVCPSRFFDLSGKLSSSFTIGTNREIIYNEQGKSYVSYLNLAKAMVDEAISPYYTHKIITVASLQEGEYERI